MKKEWSTDKIFKPATNNDISISEEFVSSIILVIIFTIILTFIHVVVGICFGVFFSIILVFRIHSYMFYKQKLEERKRRYENNEMNEEERKKYEEDLASYNKEVEKTKKLEETKRIYSIKDQQIDYTIIVGTDSRKSASSTAIRGAVGGALFGAAGLVGGAASGKNKNTTTFKIVYKSGRVEIKTVKNNSSEFNNLAKHVR